MRISLILVSVLLIPFTYGLLFFNSFVIWFLVGLILSTVSIIAKKRIGYFLSLIVAAAYFVFLLQPMYRDITLHGKPDFMAGYCFISCLALIIMNLIYLIKTGS